MLIMKNSVVGCQVLRSSKMSGYVGFIKKGKNILHDGVVKTVKDYCFTSQFGHNNDLLVVQFTDGTGTEEEGFLKLAPIEKEEE